MKITKFRCFNLITGLITITLLISASFASSNDITKNILNRIEYREIGPTRQGGRYVDFAWCEKEPNTFYAATATGGLWKTTDNGITFQPLFTNESVFSIGDVAVSPSHPNIVWVGTGEANNSRSTYWGDGMYKSTDGGKTWENMGLKESHHIGAIEIHPNNSDILYVAALGHLYSENPERGLYKTEDGGKNWNKVLDVVVKGKHIGVVDCVMDPKNPDILYAATYDKVRKPYTFNLGGPGSRIYKSTDAGKTWKKLSGGLPEGMLGRIGIDVYKKNSNIVYATIENANKPGMSDEERYQELLEDKSSEGMIGGEVYRSDDAGETWQKVSPDGQSIGGAPAYYYGQIIIDPNNDQVVHVLSAASWGTYDRGKNWKRRPLGFGGDDHALWIDPRDSSHMWLGYDHGMGITYDGGKNWYHPDNIPLAQFYAVGVDMSYPYNVAGGLQDNGSQMGPSTKRDYSPIQFEDWQRMGGGDGMYNVFDWDNNRYLYNESQFGPLQRIDLLTGESKSIAYRNVDRDMRWNWNSPILVSPHNSDVIYHCGNKVVRSPYRGETWEVISPDLTTNNPEKLTTGKGGDGNIQYCTITTMDESPLVEGLLWIGTDDGNVWITRNRGKDWTQLNQNIVGNPGYWVSRVIASHHFPGTAYVSYTGYRRDDFRAFLYKTEDYGKTWASIPSNLPDEPINVIREDHKNPDLLFVGTEFAVYVSMNGGKNWSKMKGDMPTQPVHDMIIHPRENDLVVATHGRGIFITDITFLQELSEEILEKDVYLFDIEPKVKWISNKNINYSSSNFRGESEPRGLVINYYLKNPAENDIKIKVFDGNLPINEIKAKNQAGLNQVIWNMTKKVERSPEEKKRIQERIKMYESYGYDLDIDVEYAYEPVTYGEYTFKLTIDGKELIKKSSILKDHWYK
ncbi:MAG: VPS10 domain-containing protein [Acidobacteriota bacterium]